MSTSGLQKKLDQMLQQTIPELARYDYSFVFERTRTKNPAAAKWRFTATIEDRKTPIIVQSITPARDLIKSSGQIVALFKKDGVIWVGQQPNLEGLIAQLEVSALWTPAVKSAIHKALDAHRRTQITS